jgi:DNA (cytosine-5)-methyltransferase 1
LENVRNLASHDGGNTWKVIKNKIDELGYYTYDKPVIMNALYFGVPQFRERVVIMCKRKDIGELVKLPQISRKNIRETSLKNIIEDCNNNTHSINDKMKATQQIWDNFLEILENKKIPIPKFPIWTDWWDSDGNNTTITKWNPKLSEKENKKIVLERQVNFYKKYKNWIDKNRLFYKKNRLILDDWLVSSRKK